MLTENEKKYVVRDNYVLYEFDCYEGEVHQCKESLLDIVDECTEKHFYIYCNKVVHDKALDYIKKLNLPDKIDKLLLNEEFEEDVYKLTVNLDSCLKYSVFLDLFYTCFKAAGKKYDFFESIQKMWGEESYHIYKDVLSRVNFQLKKIKFITDDYYMNGLISYYSSDYGEANSPLYIDIKNLKTRKQTREILKS